MKPRKYTSKIVDIEAVELTKDNAAAVAKWCGGMVVTEKDALDEEKTFVGINIPTLEGVMRGSEGDYIIKGLKGEFYPCKPDVFTAKYEEPIVVTIDEVSSGPGRAGTGGVGGNQIVGLPSNLRAAVDPATLHRRQLGSGDLFR